MFSSFHWRIYGEELNYQLCNHLFSCKQCFNIQMESATPIWIFTFENLSNNIKWALQFGQCLVPHILLYNFKTLQDYNSQNENPLANVGPHSFTLFHICGGMCLIPYTPSQLLPLSCFNLVHESKANVATMTKGMKIQISLCTCYNCDLH